MVDGLVSISRREEETRPTKQERKKVSYRYAPDGFQATSVDLVVPEEKMEVMSKHDTCLRKFQYSKAVDCVIMPYVTNNKPAVTVGVFQELIRWGSSSCSNSFGEYMYTQNTCASIYSHYLLQMATMPNCSFVHRRKGLKAALAGREAKSLSAILRFLIRYIGDYRFTRTLIDVANMLLGKELQKGANGEA